MDFPPPPPPPGKDLTLLDLCLMWSTHLWKINSFPCHLKFQFHHIVLMNSTYWRLDVSYLENEQSLTCDMNVLAETPPELPIDSFWKQQPYTENYMRTEGYTVKILQIIVVSKFEKSPLISCVCQLLRYTPVKITWAEKIMFSVHFNFKSTLNSLRPSDAYMRQ